MDDALTATTGGSSDASLVGEDLAGGLLAIFAHPDDAALSVSKCTVCASAARPARA